MAYWLMKSEPEAYGWEQLVKDGSTEWDGVRNNAARLHLKAMVPGDHALFYHSGAAKVAVGIMEISRGPQADGDDGQWVSVQVKPVEPLAKPVTLKDMKAEPRLAEMQMIRQSRLSVSPVSDAEWKVLMGLAKA